jgi:general nucleoside transport system permease protein
MEFLGFALLAIVTAASSYLIAAIGEYVVERAGVLNLGVEGMMIMGACLGVAGAVLTGSPWLGVLTGILGGVVLSGVFALFVLGLATNQVGTGLALTIFGLGLSGMIGVPFVGAQVTRLPDIKLPLFSDVPVIGPLIFGQNPLVYVSVLLLVAVWYVLSRTRSGLVLKAVGENHASAFAIGLPVQRVRLLAILFGGACAGLAGAFLSLVHTPLWSPGMTAGKGWIALALVVFAGGRLWRLVLGAYLFGTMTYAQLSAQAGGIAVPAQVLSALPYLVTILALVLLSLRKNRGEGAAGSLGQAFVPDR